MNVWREKNVKTDRQLETASRSSSGQASRPGSGQASRPSSRQAIVKTCADCIYPKRIDGGMWQCDHPELKRRAIRMAFYNRHDRPPIHCPLPALSSVEGEEQ